MYVTNSENIRHKKMFKNDFLHNYLVQAPIALAVERARECEILCAQRFERPILDLGCGEGLFASVLFEEKIDVGIDPNNGELLKAHAYNSYAELIPCFGDRIPKENGSFNTIFSNSVLEHILELAPVLKEIHRLLAPNGSFFVTIPSEYFEQYTWGYQLLSALGLGKTADAYRRRFNRFWRHYHCYSKEKWAEIFTAAGFKIAGSQEYGPKQFCLFNNFFTVFALPAAVLKRIANRWILCRSLRKVYLSVLYPVVGHFFRKFGSDEKGGLIFFWLRKI